MSGENVKQVLESSHEEIADVDADRNLLENFLGKDWPAYDETFNEKTIGVLIMEIYRMVPFFNEKKDIKFHPLNMPNTIVPRVNVVGQIKKIYTTKYHIDMKIDDGTGRINVVYKKSELQEVKQKANEILNKHREIARKAFLAKSWNNVDPHVLSSQTSIHKQLPQINYPPAMPVKYKAKLMHDWWIESKSGLLGKDFEVNDYLHVEGYVGFDFKKDQKPTNKMTIEDLQKGKLYIYAMKVFNVTEHDYNIIIHKKICNSVVQRYDSKVEHNIKKTTKKNCVR